MGYRSPCWTSWCYWCYDTDKLCFPPWDQCGYHQRRALHWRGVVVESNTIMPELSRQSLRDCSTQPSIIYAVLHCKSPAILFRAKRTSCRQITRRNDLLFPFYIWSKLTANTQTQQDHALRCHSSTGNLFVSYWINVPLTSPKHTERASKRAKVSMQSLGPTLRLANNLLKEDRTCKKNKLHSKRRKTNTTHSGRLLAAPACISFSQSLKASPQNLFSSFKKYISKKKLPKTLIKPTQHFPALYSISPQFYT